jgi:MFS family permease
MKKSVSPAGMTHDLKRIYFTLLLPAVAFFIAVFVLQHFHLVDWHIPSIPPVVHPLVFIISVCFAVAFPILYRTVFANQRRHQKYTAEEDWLKFERNLLYIALATPYVCLVAQILKLPRFHLAGTILMALYAVYYYYPSRKRIDYERRLFRVKA